MLRSDLSARKLKASSAVRHPSQTSVFMRSPSGNAEPRLWRRFLEHELLCPLALDVHRVDVPVRVQGEAMHPIQFARPLLAVFALGNGPELEQFAGRVEFH